MSGFVWSPAVGGAILGGQVPGQYAYPGYGGFVLAGTSPAIRGKLVVGTGGLSLSGQAPFDHFTFIHEYSYVMAGGITFGGVGRLPSAFEPVDMPAESGWVDDPGFRRGF